jgi:hypothetical protein
MYQDRVDIAFAGGYHARMISGGCPIRRRRFLHSLAGITLGLKKWRG